MQAFDDFGHGCQILRRNAAKGNGRKIPRIFHELLDQLASATSGDFTRASEFGLALNRRSVIFD
jgi:hypothetical protein